MLNSDVNCDENLKRNIRATRGRDIAGRLGGGEACGWPFSLQLITGKEIRLDARIGNQSAFIFPPICLLLLHNITRYRSINTGFLMKGLAFKKSNIRYLCPAFAVSNLGCK